MNAILRASCAAAVLLAASGAQASTIITQWNFNGPDNNPANPTATAIGAGSIRTVGTTQLETPPWSSGTANNGSSDPAIGTPPDFALQTIGWPAQGTGDKTSGIEVRVSTVGYENIRVRFDLRHSNRSSRWQQVQYSSDGTAFIDVAQFDGNAGDTWFNGREVDLSSIAAVDNNVAFAFRMVSMFAPGTQTYLPSSPTATYGGTAAGTWRFDMITVTGDPVTTVIPVPAALPLLASGLVAFGALLRRRVG